MLLFVKCISTSLRIWMITSFWFLELKVKEIIRLATMDRVTLDAPVRILRVFVVRTKTPFVLNHQPLYYENLEEYSTLSFFWKRFVIFRHCIASVNFYPFSKVTLMTLIILFKWSMTDRNLAVYTHTRSCSYGTISSCYCPSWCVNIITLNLLSALGFSRMCSTTAYEQLSFTMMNTCLWSSLLSYKAEKSSNDFTPSRLAKFSWSRAEM